MGVEGQLKPIGVSGADLRAAAHMPGQSQPLHLDNLAEVLSEPVQVGVEGYLQGLDGAGGGHAEGVGGDVGAADSQAGAGVAVDVQARHQGGDGDGPARPLALQPADRDRPRRPRRGPAADRQAGDLKRPAGDPYVAADPKHAGHGGGELGQVHAAVGVAGELRQRHRLGGKHRPDELGRVHLRRRAVQAEGPARGQRPLPPRQRGVGLHVFARQLHPGGESDLLDRLDRPQPIRADGQVRQDGLGVRGHLLGREAGVDREASPASQARQAGGFGQRGEVHLPVGGQADPAGGLVERELALTGHTTHVERRPQPAVARQHHRQLARQTVHLLEVEVGGDIAELPRPPVRRHDSDRPAVDPQPAGQRREGLVGFVLPGPVRPAEGGRQRRPAAGALAPDVQHHPGGVHGHPLEPLPGADGVQDAGGALDGLDIDHLPAGGVRHPQPPHPARAQPRHRQVVRLDPPVDPPVGDEQRQARPRAGRHEIRQ